jgi:outer membrane immunogenic protein
MRTQMPLIVGGFALLLLGSALAASADGMPAKPPDPYAYAPESVGEYDWSGIYVGGGIGGATAKWNWAFIAPFENVQNHGTGWMGGAQVGIQKQWDWKLLGVEVSYAWPDLDTTSGSAAVPGASRSAELSSLLTVAARVGVTWQNILAYVKGGYANADITFRSHDVGSGLLLTSSSGRGDGWVAGLGLEYGLHRYITLGVEYDYLRLNSGSRDQVPTGFGVAGSRAEGSVDAQAVMARVNFLFAPHSEPPPMPPIK